MTILEIKHDLSKIRKISLFLLRRAFLTSTSITNFSGGKTSDLTILKNFYAYSRPFYLWCKFNFSCITLCILKIRCWGNPTNAIVVEKDFHKLFKNIFIKYYKCTRYRYKGLFSTISGENGDFSAIFREHWGGAKVDFASPGGTLQG